jgi:hypothetical protein
MKGGYGKDFAVTVEDWITCSCGKRGWPTRRQAKAKVRELSEDDLRTEPISVYRCRDGTTNLFHVGHKRPGPNLNDPRLSWIA